MTYPLPFVAAVVADLNKENIPIVEYGDLLNARFGYPVCINTIRWAIPDSEVSRVSKILLEHNIPKGGIIAHYARSYGKWETAGEMHKHGSTRIQLIPLSTLHLSLEDCEEVTSTFSLQQKALIPKPQPYLISLIRILQSLPLGLPRVPIIADTALFLDYCVFPRLPDDEDEESESEEHFQQRVEQALSLVRQWDWRPEDAEYFDLSEQIIRNCQLLYTLKA
ncbi:hypothetical protein MGYG_04868 [Nannizzia gypsea CBS 118893]|uniref:Uncharacterized protein n=1 Tax=Arthroderma gypseum (strain ATCC MYA-4604 / CBS 118893) TaxID=535722 RepID=E4UX70_ARTGP|nr:hypothetical protein MGYG_04868 [Nannizzia gypsea CBS 118893]EFR01870.1 hypothetical protein MGYG_04868 [Nannizzia gypsea CBS 118893]